MRKKYSTIIILILMLILAIEIGLNVNYFPQIEIFKQQLQTDEELQISYANSGDMSIYDEDASGYKGKLYRENSVITDLAKEKINAGLVTIENMAVTPTTLRINGKDYEIKGLGKIKLELPNAVNIEVLKGVVIIYNEE